MDANQVIQLGPLQVPLSWLMLFVGLFAAVIIAEKTARKRNWEKDKWSDFIIVLFVVFLVVFKFGWVLFDLKRVIQNPASLIWTSGSTLSLILAVVASLLLVIYRIRKNQYPVYDVLDLGWITLTITLLLYNLVIMDYGKVTDFIFGVSLNGEYSFQYHPVNWYKAFWIGLLLILRFRIWSNITTSRIQQLYVLLGVGLLFTSIFNVPLNLLFGFTVYQWGYIAIVLIGSLGLMQK